MKWLIKISMLIILFGWNLHSMAQTITMDPILTTTVVGLDLNENQIYDKITGHQTTIQRFQILTMGIEDQINQIQKKTYSALQQVSSAVKNTYQIYLCYKILQNIYKNEREMIDIATGNPLALGFAVKLQKEATQMAIGVYADVSNIVLAENNNKMLLSAGDRLRILRGVVNKLSQIEILTLTSKYEVKRVVRQGLINAINPFSGFVNRDARIAHSIITQWKW